MRARNSFDIKDMWIVPVSHFLKVMLFGAPWSTLREEEENLWMQAEDFNIDVTHTSSDGLEALAQTMSADDSEFRKALAAEFETFGPKLNIQ